MLCLHSDVSFPFTSTAEYLRRCFHSNLEDFINLQTLGIDPSSCTLEACNNVSFHGEDLKAPEERGWERG